MKQLLMLDAKNYDAEMPEICRRSARGIIFLAGKLLLIEDASGKVKLPGGGVEGQESDQQTLIREVLEETGYAVLPDTIIPFGEIEEKRLSAYEPMIWHHISHLYFCEVSLVPGNCTYTENEKKHGFRPALYTVEEALEKNRCVLAGEGLQPWNQREYQTLLLLREHLAGK